MKNPIALRHFLKLMAVIAILTATASPGWASSEATSVNINTASAEEISIALNGIGLKKAEAIVQWREKHGNFSKIDELIQVKGVGNKILVKNSDRIKLE